MNTNDGTADIQMDTQNFRGCNIIPSSLFVDCLGHLIMIVFMLCVKLF